MILYALHDINLRFYKKKKKISDLPTLIFWGM